MAAFKLALAQLHVTSSKAKNIEAAIEAIQSASKQGAKLIALPECFNTPYGTSYFPEYAETIPGATTDALSAAAREHKVATMLYAL